MNTKKIFHWFWAWQDEKEENWLGEMARQGWHLKQPDAFGNHTFSQGEPSEMAYRLDFFTDAKNKAGYLQIFQDAGWEYVGEAGTWQYFRKPVLDGEVPEIYTDNESKIRKYRRVLAVLIVFLPIYTMMLNRLSQAEGWLYRGAFLIAFSIILLYLYAMIKLISRITQLRRGKE